MVPAPIAIVGLILLALVSIVIGPGSQSSAGERLPEPLEGPGEGAPRESSDRVTQG